MDDFKEDMVDAVVDVVKKENKRRGQSTAGGEVKSEDTEAAPTSERDPSVVKEPVDIRTST